MPDPWGEASWRYWDGVGWTGRTAPADPGAPFAAIKSLAGQTLILQRERTFSHTALDLRHGADAVARYTSRGVDEDRAWIEAHAAEGSWLFVPQLHNEWEIHLVAQPGGQHIATFEPNYGSFSGAGAVTFGDGRRFGWQAEQLPRTEEPQEESGGGIGGFLKSAAKAVQGSGTGRWEIVHADGRQLLTGGYGEKRGLPGSDEYDMVVNLGPNAADHAEAPVLTLFTGYMLYRLWAQRWRTRRGQESMFDDD